MYLFRGNHFFSTHPAACSTLFKIIHPEISAVYLSDFFCIHFSEASDCVHGHLRRVDSLGFRSLITTHGRFCNRRSVPRCLCTLPFHSILQICDWPLMFHCRETPVNLRFDTLRGPVPFKWLTVSYRCYLSLADCRLRNLSVAPLRFLRPLLRG